MQISLEGIHKRGDPYQLFLDSITNSETRRKYINWLHRFLKLIPSTLFEANVAPEKQEIVALAKSFVVLAKKDPDQ